MISQSENLRPKKTIMCVYTVSEWCFCGGMLTIILPFLFEYLASMLAKLIKLFLPKHTVTSASMLAKMIRFVLPACSVAKASMFARRTALLLSTHMVTSTSMLAKIRTFPLIHLGRDCCVRVACATITYSYQNIHVGQHNNVITVTPCWPEKWRSGSKEYGSGSIHAGVQFLKNFLQHRAVCTSPLRAKAPGELQLLLLLLFLLLLLRLAMAPARTTLRGMACHNYCMKSVAHVPPFLAFAQQLPIAVHEHRGTAQKMFDVTFLPRFDIIQ